MAQPYEFTLDYKIFKGYPVMIYTKGDAEATPMIITLTDRNIAENLTNKYVTVTIKRPDNQSFVYTANIVAQNKISFTPNLQALNTQGIVLANIQVYEDNIRVSTTRFQYLVAGELINGELVEDDSNFPVLSNLIDDVNEAKEDIGVIGSLSEDLTEKIDDAEAIDGTLASRITSGNTLKNNLDTNIATGSTLHTNLTNDTTAANTAKSNLDVSITTAGTTKSGLDASNSTANSTKTTLENTISDADTAKEDLENVIATADTTTYATKGEINAVNSELAERVQQIQLDYYKYMYGYFQKPDDFKPTLPCNFFRDSNGKMQNDMDFSQYTGGTKIYINLDTGNDTTGNGSQATPYKTLAKAFTIASTGDAKSEIIVLSDTPFMRDESAVAMAITNKTIALVPQNTTNRIIITGGQRSLAWTSDGSGTYHTSRTNAKQVIDFTSKDSDGAYIPYTPVSSIANCQALAGSWYTDGTLVYVHTLNGATPTDSTICVNMTSINTFSPQLLGTSKLYIKNCDIATAPPMRPRGDSTGATVVGDFVAEKCTFSSGYKAYGDETNGNSVQVENIKNTYLFDCVSSYSTRDCFNYHYMNVPSLNRRDCLVIEYNCNGKDAGVTSTDVNNNISTAHEGISIIRFTTTGVNASIPLADVDDCYSICVDCDMSGARYTSGTYYFGYGTNGQGKAIVINCKSDGDAIGLKADVNTYIYKFTGNIANTGKQVVIA
jgi:hypothetical protein